MSIVRMKPTSKMQDWRLVTDTPAVATVATPFKKLTTAGHL
jgi:hypothetical protein